LARKVDAEADAASKAILDQLQTKTVGAPPSTTGLTGDQLPNTIFNVDTFDQVRNQVTLQLTNLELLNVLNTIGQVTNTQSQSGPLPGQMEIVETDVSSANTYVTVFTPAVNEVWQFLGFNSRGAVGLSGTISYELDIFNPNTNDRLLLIDASSSSSSDFPLIESGNFAPIYITNPFVVRVRVEGTFTTSLVSTGFIRVR
jgi:hypothetical protein